MFEFISHLNGKMCFFSKIIIWKKICLEILGKEKNDFFQILKIMSAVIGNSAMGNLYGFIFNLKLFEFLKELIIIDIFYLCKSQTSIKFNCIN